MFRTSCAVVGLEEKLSELSLDCNGNETHSSHTAGTGLRRKGETRAPANQYAITQRTRLALERTRLALERTRLDLVVAISTPHTTYLGEINVCRGAFPEERQN